MKFTLPIFYEGHEGIEAIGFEGINIGGRCIDGVKFPVCWNGWECPAFTKEAADEIVAAINACPAEYDMGRMEYFATDEGGYYTSVYDGIEERFYPMDIDGVAYYPIGTCAWTWKVDLQIYADISRVFQESASDIGVDFLMCEFSDYIADDIVEHSAYAEENGTYTDNDIRLAIGRVLMDKLVIPVLSIR